MNKNDIFSILQRLGGAFMVPIAVLPVAGMLLGVGGSFSNTSTIALYPILDHKWLQAVFTIMTNSGGVVFANLPLLFAVALSSSFANEEKGVAGLAGALGFLIMHTTIHTVLSLTGTLAEPDVMVANGQGMVLGIQTLEMSVFGGILVGLVTSWLHNKYRQIELNPMLAFFGGVRFVPIVVSLTFIIIGSLMTFIWPVIQSGISALVYLVDHTGYIGTFFYGMFERLLIPMGLHHVFYLPFWQTPLGGTLEIGGRMVSGAQNIFFAQVADSSIEHFHNGTARFMAGRMPAMMFAYPAACLAMYRSALLENKPVVKGILLSAALTSFFTGITEPILFLFLFVAPVLFVINAVIFGLSFMLMHILNVTVGQTFSGGLIDFLLFGVLQGVSKTNWIYIPVVGLGLAVLEYIAFTFCIKKFNLLTPGREKKAKNANTNAKNAINSSSEDSEELSSLVLKAIGGKDNIVTLDACITRLRLKLKDTSIIDKEKLTELGAAGVFQVKDSTQVIFGPKASVIKQDIQKLL